VIIAGKFSLNKVTLYCKDIELKMQRLFARLSESEKDKHSYAAIESVKLGHGGVEYVFVLFGIDPKTVRSGLTDLEAEEDPASHRFRKKGRKERYKRAK